MAEVRLQTTGAGVIAKEDFTLDDLHRFIIDKGVAWLDINKPDEEIKEFLVDKCNVDELAIEDIFGESANTVQRFDDHRFVVVRARDADSRLDTEPVAILIFDSLIITVRHTRIPALKSFRRRMKTADKEEIGYGVDFLLYELLDSIADDWQPILGEYSDELDELEYRVFDPSTRYDGLLEGLHGLKRQLREANKSIESLHSATIRILKPGERLISEETLPYFTDLQQLVSTLVNRANNYSSGATSTRDTYLSHVSLSLAKSNARLTEVMTTLTIIGAIMLPLTLIAGIFGMNTALPGVIEDLGGFWTIMSAMLLFSLVMISYFFRKGWIGSGD
jgi:magnesium transporter